MRLWSLHPRLLDSKGLIACWREGLLAQAVLLNFTKGYKNHSQLIRFKQTEDPIGYLGSFLLTICNEASKRNYNFDIGKITRINFFSHIPVTTKQIEFEFNHLQQKLIIRDNAKHLENKVMGALINPIFQQCDGEIESWEKL
jgi:hypothetical protein